MKHRFLITLITALPVALVIILGAKWATLAYTANSMQWKLGEGKNVVAIGQSHGMDAINDSILDNWANECRSAEMNFGTYTMLRYLLAENKIDTVVLPMVDFKGYSNEAVDTRYLLYQNTRLAVADGEVLRDLFATNWMAMVSFYMTNDIQTMLQDKVIGGYENWDSHTLGDEVKRREVMLARDGRVKCPSKPMEEFSLQTKYMTRILQLCRDKGVKVVVMNYPKYKYDRYTDRKDVDKYYRSLGDSIVIAEYERFAFPDTTHYANVRHLNAKGAAVLCNHIREHGLVTLKTGEWKGTTK